MDATYLTQDKYDELMKELEELKTGGRREVAERLKHAKELGDLSENSEYQEAREQQSRIEQKISQLEDLLRSVSIIEKSSAGNTVIKIGSRVTVEKGGQSIAYTIVGSQDADPALGKISNESPIGRSLLGLSVGASAHVTTPKGDVAIKVLRIE
jgi:transcription elongation factor GreA